MPEQEDFDVKNKNRNKKQAGDVLGISDSPASARIPQATTDHGGHPQGIEIGEHRRHRSAFQPGKGATGIDMGAGGSGTDIETGERKD
jgi:hypothetical protein